MATIKYWNGSSWVATQIGGEVYVQPDQPASTTVGALWIDTDTVPPTFTSVVQQTYAITAGYTSDRALNPQICSLSEVATVLGTLIDDLRVAGILK